MIAKLSYRIRKGLARRFPGRFTQWYSTLDNPQVVPVQEAAYRLAVEKYLRPADRVLDVGFGLGYGLEMMAGAGRRLAGIDVDAAAVAAAGSLPARIPGLERVAVYDGTTIPYPDRAFDVVTCIDVIEHVPDYLSLLSELLRVAGRAVLVSTPNRRPEFTRPDGRPSNVWHLREWSYPELDAILRQVPDAQVDWNFLDGQPDGPFQVCGAVSARTLALTPALLRLA